MDAAVRLPAEPAWRAAIAVADRLARAGHRALIAGGAVRDLLLGRDAHDVDLATDAVPDRVQELFPRTVAVGKAFGVVIVAHDGVDIEVATFRADGAYGDGRRPDSVRFGDAAADAQRRDFTINALFLDPADGTIHDHVGGRDDLARRIIRAVGDPAARLAEDRLRILRAIRFAAHLDCAIEPRTWDALRATPLTGLSAERVVQEWDKAVAGAQPAVWFRLLAAAGRLGEVFPPLAAAPPERIDAIARRLLGLRRLEPVDVAAALCLADADPAVRAAWLEAQPLPRARAQRLAWLWRHAADPGGIVAADVPTRRRLLRHPDAASLARLIQLLHPGHPGTMQILGWQHDEARQPDLPPLLTAGDLVAAGMRPGPLLGRVLRAVEDARLRDEISDRAQALTLAARMAAAP